MYIHCTAIAKYIQCMASYVHMYIAYSAMHKHCVASYVDTLHSLAMYVHAYVASPTRPFVLQLVLQI